MTFAASNSLLAPLAVAILLAACGSQPKPEAPRAESTSSAASEGSAGPSTAPAPSTAAAPKASQWLVNGVSVSSAKASDLRAALREAGWNAFSVSDATPDSMYARTGAIACKGADCRGNDEPTLQLTIDRGVNVGVGMPLGDVFEANEASASDYPQLFDKAADVLVVLTPPKGMSNADAKALLERIVRRP
jgi:hypothetical protein